MSNYHFTTLVPCSWESSMSLWNNYYFLAALLMFSTGWFLKCMYGNYTSPRTYCPLYLVLSTYFWENLTERKKTSSYCLVRWHLRTGKREERQAFKHSGRCNGPWQSFLKLRTKTIVISTLFKGFFPLKSQESLHSSTSLIM